MLLFLFCCACCTPRPRFISLLRLFFLSLSKKNSFSLSRSKRVGRERNAKNNTVVRSLFSVRVGGKLYKYVHQHRSHFCPAFIIMDVLYLTRSPKGCRRDTDNRAKKNGFRLLFVAAKICYESLMEVSAAEKSFAYPSDHTEKTRNIYPTYMSMSSFRTRIKQ